VSWKYSQSSGELTAPDGMDIATGYSGHDTCRNLPSAQGIPDMGPIPAGFWMIGGPPLDTSTHGPYVLGLAPATETETFGRSGFLIHGDSVENAGQFLASRGCIILPREAREAIWESGDGSLEVVP